jgi:threonine/homoserine/homoserine lactone efflux protein
MLWWMLLAGTVSALRKRVSRGAIVWVNRASGLLLGIFGVYVLADAFFAR